MKDYYFDLFKKTEYSLEYLDSLNEDELKDYFCEQTWDDDEGVINEDKCKQSHLTSSLVCAMLVCLTRVSGGYT